MRNGMEFTIILPVCHGGRFLRNALHSLHRVDFPPLRFEVIVAGTHDDRESQTIVQSESVASPFGIRYAGCLEAVRSKQLNEACAAARGRVLAFADDDCIFRKDWLRKLREIFECEPDIGVVGGRDELEPGGSAFALALDSVLNSFSGTGGLRRGSSRTVGRYYPKLWNMAVSREVALDVSAKTDSGIPRVFNEFLGVHEDVDLTDRVEKSGKRVLFSPELCIGHNRDTTFWSFVRRNFNMARASRTLHVHRLPHMVLAALALGMPVLTLASFFVRPLGVALLCFMGIYGMTLLTSAIMGLRRTRNPGVLAIIPVLLVSLHLARGLGYLFPYRKPFEEENP